MKTFLRAFALLFCVASFAQTTVKGTVSDDSGMPLAGANIIVTGTSSGAMTDFDGNFTLSTSEIPPFTIQISSVGFETLSQQVSKNNQTLSITLKEGNALDEVVISASRTPERIFESPVTVERFGIKDIKTTPAVDFYGGLENMKGVDINQNSLTFRSVNTRGFATVSNTRFMQLVDGMDNSTPALNFPIGNLVGMIETDVQSVELLPGASSALYGANAFNGILFMTSKNPFDSEGISTNLKRGMTSQEASGDNAYTDFSIRMAHKFSDKFAAKVNFGWLQGHDWAATSEVDSNIAGGTRETNLSYNGINVYGDEYTGNINDVAQFLESIGAIPAGASALVPSVGVSRTGYNEEDLTNYNAESIKADWGLYFRPFEDDFEIAYVGKMGTGTTMFQGINRYTIKNFFQEQHKLEIKNDNFFVRGYMVADNAGDSYDMTFTGINVNRAWKDDNTWFGQYAGTYLGATLQGAPSEQAHAIARGAADTGRFLPGSPEFQSAFDQSVNDPDLLTGSKFQDESKYYHVDANYNFSHLIDFVDIQVGGSFREYNLNSGGTIYTDTPENGPISYSEFGLYSQLQKEVDLNEAMKLKLTGSVRYDKSEFFDGFISPRFSAGLTVNRNHNFRASVQTGFRNPTTQDLFIGLNSGQAFLVGSAPSNLDRYSGDYGVSVAGQGLLNILSGGQGAPSSITQTGRSAYENSYTLNSVQAFAASGGASPLEVANPDLATPEQVTSLEVGYRGKFENLIVDFSAYHSTYNDFLSTEVVIAPLYGNVSDGTPPGLPLPVSAIAIANGDFNAYSAYTNSRAVIKSYGAALGLSTKVYSDFDLSANYTYAHLDHDTEKYPDFNTNFNTPEHKFKASFGNPQLFKNFGFNIAYRYSVEYEWEASFGNGTIPEFQTVDAQINYAVPSLKSTFKAGANNLLGTEYFTMFGSGNIGSMYYLSWTINN
ncbi:MAG: TonB-dependent receptor [Algibacter sp.]|uniref:TonB-dependent receptor n=1 Tax=Algibacter sp. TaxID=1872428 RepID=UPI002613AD8A|nr:TonB-dependent receptor [Algibacter sp.]MDG1728922.1 TonB-dependent receptor [Algibacter sp.]